MLSLGTCSRLRYGSSYTPSLCGQHCGSGSIDRRSDLAGLTNHRQVACRDIDYVDRIQMGDHFVLQLRADVSVTVQSDVRARHSCRVLP